MKINYQSIGSGGGIRQLSEQTVDFGASDAPMSDAELAKAKGGPVLHIPTALGAVVIVYNLPEVSAPLKLTGDVIAAIYQGQITKWNDARIAALNPGVKLPATDILVVHRSDGSGTSYVFTDYLASVSPAWATKPGKGKEVQWPVGLGAKGNEGVAGQVKQTPGAIGYVELAYATQNKMAMASVKNANGEFVAPSIASVTAAAAGAAAKLAPDDGLPGLDRERAGSRRLPDLVLHLDHRLRQAGRCREGEEADGFSSVGAQRRAGDGGGARLRAAPGGDADCTADASRFHQVASRSPLELRCPSTRPPNPCT